MIASSTGTFDIRNFSDHLTPAKGANRYICPACGGNNLTISPKDGKYKCWNECECKAIRDAIAPLDFEIQGQDSRIPQPKQKQKAKAPNPTPIPDGEIELAKFPNPVESPARIDSGQFTEITYPYSETQWVVRRENPDGSKATYPYHKNSDGKPTIGKGDTAWEPYRMEEVRIYGSGKWVLGVEGEKCVEAARQLELVTWTLLGGSWGEATLIQSMQLILDAGVVGVVYFPDHDETGYTKAKKLANAAAKVGLPLIEINPVRLWTECPEKGDIADWVKLEMNTEEFIRRLEEEIHRAVEEGQQHSGVVEKGSNTEIPYSANPKVTFLQQAMDFLYGDKPWISADDKLYYHTGNYYKYSPDSRERPRIASFCNSYVVAKTDKDGNVILDYPYAKPAKVREVLQWIKDRVEVDPELLNPSGVNCTNGIVRVVGVNDEVVVRLDPHTPNDYFIYEPLVEYNPFADTTDCDRLLSCLDKPQQEILLRTLAASIDIDMVRALRGREVRLLLASGLGSNGKDSLREVVSTIFGHSGMTSLTTADFENYDNGRKFGLSALINSRVNWASENPQTARLDKIQSLKLFATGNKLHCERKGKDHIEYTPKAIGIFNINEPPSLQGTMQAIQDRIAVLEFLKTFKKNPDPNNPNELKADPRFAYNPEFVRTLVAPAFLNKMLKALSVLIAEGIDYECTSDAFRSMQKENNHLFQFLEDTNIGYKPDGTMSAKELWSFLEKWYIDNGTLIIEEDGKRRTWIDQVKPSDKNVKGINQIIPRIMTLFPKAEKSTRYDEVAKRNIPIIKGIGIIENTRTTIENNRTSSAPIAAPQTTDSQDERTTRTTFDGSEKNHGKIDNAIPSNDLNNELNLSPTSPIDDYPLIGGASGAEANEHNGSSHSKCCGGGAESGAGIDLELIKISAQLIKDAIAEMDDVIIEALTEKWTDDLKQAVVEQLSPEDKKALIALAPLTFPSLAAIVKPQVTSVALAPSFVVGDVVSVLDYPKLKGKRVTVSSITTAEIWVRLPNAIAKRCCEAQIAPFGPFHPHQLRKC